MSLFDSGGGAFGPIGGAAGPATSGISPVFQIAASDTSSILTDRFLGQKTGTSQTTMMLAVGAALVVGVGLTLLAKKLK